MRMDLEQWSIAVEIVRLAAVGLLLALPAPGHATDAGTPPVVVELFTSQSCDPCPAADRFIGELARRPGVVALTYNIDYWNYTGWHDTLASPANAERQRGYIARGVGRFLHTPQLVVGGVESVLGSDRDAVLDAITRARLANQSPVAVRLELVPPSFLVHVAGNGDKRGADATVRLVRYSLKQSVVVTSGDNAGRTLTYSNVVKDFRDLGRWRGQPLRLELDAATVMQGTDDGCAVIVQRDSDGLVLGAEVFLVAGRP